MTVREVHDSLSSLNVGKAIGPNMIPNRVLKDFAPELVPLIMDIYNCSLREGYVPDLLKWSIINPLSLFSATRNSIWLETYLSDMHTCQSHRRVCAQQARGANCGKTWSTPVRKGGALHHGRLDLYPTGDSRGDWIVGIVGLECSCRLLEGFWPDWPFNSSEGSWRFSI